MLSIIYLNIYIADYVKRRKTSINISWNKRVKMSCMRAATRVQNIKTLSVFTHIGLFSASTRPFPSSLVPLFQNESKWETFHMKMSSACSFIFKQIKVIFI